MLQTKNILIVSLAAGSGHIKAAQAIEKAILLTYPGIKVKNIDLLDYATVFSKNFYQKTYLNMVNFTPKLYAWLYKNLDQKSTKIRLLSDRINTQKFEKLVNSLKPDLIICTHFVPANLLTLWRRRKKISSCPIWLVLTDYEVHPLWVDQEVDLYAVASAEMKNDLAKFGIKKDRINVTGIPIDLKFSKRFDREKLKKKLGLANKPTIALFSGGFGLGPVEQILKKILPMDEDFQVLVSTGKNQDLYDQVVELAKHYQKKTLVFQFVDNIEEIYAASDLIISKPGGLTVSETLAMATPLLIFNPIPGQEEANARFLLQNKAALRADNFDEIINLIKKIIREPQILASLKRNIKKIAQPKAAIKIIKEIK